MLGDSLASRSEPARDAVAEANVSVQSFVSELSIGRRLGLALALGLGLSGCSDLDDQDQ